MQGKKTITKYFSDKERCLICCFSKVKHVEKCYLGFNMIFQSLKKCKSVKDERRITFCGKTTLELFHWHTDLKSQAMVLSMTKLKIKQSRNMHWTQKICFNTYSWFVIVSCQNYLVLSQVLDALFCAFWRIFCQLD